MAFLRQPAEEDGTGMAAALADPRLEDLGVHSFAEAQEVVNYEPMTRLSRDIPRHVLEPGCGEVTYVRGLDHEPAESAPA